MPFCADSVNNIAAPDVDMRFVRLTLNMKIKPTAVGDKIER